MIIDPLPHARQDPAIGRHLRAIALRCSIIDSCQFRCSYCRPAGTEQPAATAPLAIDELLRLIDVVDRAKPVRKIRLTGGEPTLHPDLVAMVAALREQCAQRLIALTTNGLRLAGLADELAEAGLAAVNVSLDAADEEGFRRMTGRGGLDRVIAGIEAAAERGLRVKINCVLHEAISAEAIVALVRLARRCTAEIRFIELMPIGPAAGFDDTAAWDMPRLRDLLAYSFEERGSATASDTALRQRYLVDGAEQVVGFIPTRSEPFCATCDRFRLDSSGRFWQCLRNDTHLDLRQALAQRGAPAAIAELRALIRDKSIPAFDEGWTERPMLGIGG